ncbi:MAG: NADase-type glycan-binding domain-containing protein [Labedaea sp.]
MSDVDWPQWQLPPADVESAAQDHDSQRPHLDYPQSSLYPQHSINPASGAPPPKGAFTQDDPPQWVNSTPGPVSRPGKLKPAIVAAATLATLAVGIGITVVTLHPWSNNPTTDPGVRDIVTQPSLAQDPPFTSRSLSPPSAISATASCTSPPSHDAGGNPTSYEAQKVIDGRPDTAWRCDGNGVGQQLRLTFGGTVTLTHIGVIPGLAKVDPYDATDRYAQNRRVSAVRYTFDDGRTIDQNFDTSISNRSIQSISVPHVESSSITITISTSVAGSAQNNQPAVDKVAISEVAVS